ncbi:hypothetical protein CROQUDRAFT_356980 [Cronartium quercuum f. sp. fusiforme G11]|uniref:Uncharacterized protein n=1 Tax=Cronartium quercuum f. sp. fusiforme G11 TaxID=708437 RepID=A0A9P6T7I0_9BASI|nr:hypothetical protein CROQUDRAFT_356980 [Cronartium quercuum f. sp. fusiforme G11]
MFISFPFNELKFTHSVFLCAHPHPFFNLILFPAQYLSLCGIMLLSDEQLGHYDSLLSTPDELTGVLSFEQASKLDFDKHHAIHALAQDAMLRLIDDLNRNEEVLPGTFPRIQRVLNSLPLISHASSSGGTHDPHQSMSGSVSARSSPKKDILC